jgi:hypothetical protein
VSKVSLICNQYEYEIIYKKSYSLVRMPSGTQGVEEESKDDGPPPGLHRINNMN